MSLLKLIDIEKSYGSQNVLKKVNIDVEKGEVVVILGPSGCGKSTLLRCINGLEEITEGEILFNNKRLGDELLWKDLRGNIGMVFQNYELFPHMNVIDNILLGPVKAQKRDKKEVEIQADELLRRVGLYERKKSFPRELSGGQKQRIAIVRALCLNPEIILFDEVTAALDPEMVREVLEVILGLAQNGMTMLIVTHEMHFARKVADKIIFIDEGQVIEVGTPIEFFENPKTDRAKKFLDIFNY